MNRQTRSSYRDSHAQYSPMNQDIYYENYQQQYLESPYLQNLMNPITPKRRVHRFTPYYENFNSPSQQFLQQSYNKLPYSLFRAGQFNNRSSQMKQRNSSKQTKIDNQVRAFDEQEYAANNSEYSFQQNKSIRMTIPKESSFTTLSQLFEQNKSQRKHCKTEEQEQEQEQNFLYQKLQTTQNQLIQLNQSISDIEQHLNRLQLEEFELQQNSSIQIMNKSITKIGMKKDIKFEKDEKPQLRLFSTQRIQPEQVMTFGRPENTDKSQLIMMQQSLNHTIGRLSQLLHQGGQNKLGNFNRFDDEDDDIQDAPLLSFNKTFNKFTRIYQCKFCDQKFNKACSLGGHISRVHKLESQQAKENSPLPLKKCSIQKRKKLQLLKCIEQCIKG